MCVINTCLADLSFLLHLGSTFLIFQLVIILSSWGMILGCKKHFKEHSTCLICLNSFLSICSSSPYFLYCFF
uniref:Uncharacterized protein n=1 Tax=Octopus bimaculoides TaxID=37653 RepID=A0A0L8I2L5_OCTBM